MAYRVRTVLGDVAPVALGFTLPHEHLVNFPPKRERPDPDYHLNDVQKAIEEVNRLKRAGGAGLVEMTAYGYGRDVRALKHIAQKTGLHIVCTTGLIMESFFPPEAFNYTQSQLTDWFVKEVVEGIENTDVRAGVIKCGTSQNRITKTEEKVIRAAAKAHRLTGAPISTHTMGGSMALAQVELLRAEGVDTSRIIIGHLDRKSLNIGYLKLLARTGVYLGIDNVGKTKYYPDQLRIQILKELIADGFVQQILLADDNGRRSYFASYGGGPGLDYIPKRFVPMMHEAGIGPTDTEQITVTNPHNALAFETTPGPEIRAPSE